MKNILQTGIQNARNVGRYIFGSGCLSELESLLKSRRSEYESPVIFVVDDFFRDNREGLVELPCKSEDQLIYVDTQEEPTTDGIDNIVRQVSRENKLPCAVVGVGGGSTLDSAKAVSNLLTNKGCASDYQGWDLLRFPGVYKIGIPTISGTGAETTRTCVITNKANDLKLGMNSEYTVFDQIILDPDLTATVPRDQYFYTGMDAWIHCVEALSGRYRNPIGDAFSQQAIELCRKVFCDSDMMNERNRSNLLVASYLGGCAIATSYVGVVHPFSAGLSVVLGLHHCVSNCIAFLALESFYPTAFREFIGFVETQEVKIPKNVCEGLSDSDFEALYYATIVHEKPLVNALGTDFHNVLTKKRVRQIFEAM